MASQALVVLYGLIFLAEWPTVGRLAWAQDPGVSSPASKLAWIRPSEDKTHFVRDGTNDRVVMWGFNYDHDDAGRLLEDYWRAEWATVAEDFREMKGLGANVVRVHLQLARFMKDTGQPDEDNLALLTKLVRLAEDTGLYLDVTGLGCYHKKDVPEWYDGLEESARWDVQARFWKAIAGVCKHSPAIFCYDLMNEPVLASGEGKKDWLPGPPLGGKHFVQRIAIDSRGRNDKEIARAWVERLAAAIRSVDVRHMITVGVIPWAQVFTGAKPLFYAPEVCGPLDFVSVHFYPKAGKLDDDLAALKVYEVGKPLVIEEIFPLAASVEETGTFIERSRAHADGWISFYWGKRIDQYEKAGDLNGAVVSGWLRRFRSLSPYRPSDGKQNNFQSRPGKSVEASGSASVIPANKD
jgi:Cellulase (glycosyl hydrolase family 5)